MLRRKPEEVLVTNSFAHEQFPVYQEALNFLAFAGETGALTTRGFRFLRDQLLRAVESRRPA